MTPEQKQRIEQIEKWQESRRGLVDSARKHADLDASHPEIRMHGYIDFLLSLVQSQEAGGSKLSATTAAIEWERGRTALRKGLNQSDFDSLVAKLAALIESAATSMRSACVEKVKEYLTDCRDEERGIIEAIANELELVSIQEQE